MLYVRATEMCQFKLYKHIFDYVYINLYKFMPVYICLNHMHFSATARSGHELCKTGSSRLPV